MEPRAPLKVKWYHTGAGARRIDDAGRALGGDHVVERADAGGVDRVVLQRGDDGGGSSTRNVIESSSGLAPHQRGLRVNTIRWAVRSIVETMNGPGRRAGSVELALVEYLRVRRHAARLQIPSGEHSAPFGVRLGEGDHCLPVVDASGHRLHPLEPRSAGDQVTLVACRCMR